MYERGVQKKEEMMHLLIGADFEGRTCRLSTCITRAARAANDTWLAAAADDDNRGADAGTRELDSGADADAGDDGDGAPDEAAVAVDDASVGDTTSVDRSGADNSVACTTGSMLSTHRANARFTWTVARASSSSRRSLWRARRKKKHPKVGKKG